MKRDFLESSARRLVPKYFANVSDEQVRIVKQYMAEFTEHAFADTPVAAVLNDAVASQGKMIRPRLLLMAAQFGPDGKDIRDELYRLAALVEMTHLASLIHDDIVDDAPFRRGKPSVQSKYGKNAAVYAGDFLMSRISYYLMADYQNRAGIVLTKTVEAMCLGEISQAMSRFDASVTMDQYLKNIHGKTAALFMACCRIGAMESGCNETTTQTLESFGECLGYMFQMRDDFLDFEPDSRLGGKKGHQDFREGIYTLPVLLAREQPGGKEALLPFMEKSAAGTLTKEDVYHMEEIVAAYGGMELGRKTIAQYAEKAKGLLNSLPSQKVTSTLLKLIDRLEDV